MRLVSFRDFIEPQVKAPIIDHKQGAAHELAVLSAFNRFMKFVENNMG